MKCPSNLVITSLGNVMTDWKMKKRKKRKKDNQIIFFFLLSFFFFHFFFFCRRLENFLLEARKRWVTIKTAVRSHRAWSFRIWTDYLICFVLLIASFYSDTYVHIYLHVLIVIHAFLFLYMSLCFFRSRLE